MKRKRNYINSFAKKASETANDEAFVTMVSQEYYLRVFQDVFDETVPVRLDKIARAFPR